MDDYAREIAQNHFDAAHPIDAAAGAVHIFHADADAFDESRILAKLLAKSLPDVCPIIVIEVNSGKADIRRNPRRIHALNFPLQSSRDAIGERYSLLVAHSRPVFVRHPLCA